MDDYRAPAQRAAIILLERADIEVPTAVRARAAIEGYGALDREAALRLIADATSIDAPRVTSGYEPTGYMDDDFDEWVVTGSRLIAGPPLAPYLVEIVGALLDAEPDAYPAERAERAREAGLIAEVERGERILGTRGDYDLAYREGYEERLAAAGATYLGAYAEPAGGRERAMYVWQLPDGDLILRPDDITCGVFRATRRADLQADAAARRAIKAHRYAPELARRLASLERIGALRVGVASWLGGTSGLDRFERDGVKGAYGGERNYTAPEVVERLRGWLTQCIAEHPDHAEALRETLALTVPGSIEETHSAPD